jgi:dibenzothiophene sulfone monooxygenase
MHLAGYVLVPGSHFQGMWRHPYSQTDFFSRRLYEQIGVTLEEGLFDLAFIPEALAIPDAYQDSFATTVEFGLQGAVRPDPSFVAAAIGGVTSHLGVGVTMSTTYTAAYHIARIFSTLDHFTNGRVAWNMITSGSESNARNFGDDRLPEHDGRYELADETVAVCEQLWGSWEPDALVLDKSSGRFADPERVHYIDHVGERLKVKGPLTLTHSPQGGPVLIQAGASPRGRHFGATWAEMIFSILPISHMKEFRDDLRRRAAELGRDPDRLKIITAVQPTLGETTEIAHARLAYLEQLIDLRAALAQLSTHLDIDLADCNPEADARSLIAQVEKHSALPILDRVAPPDGPTVTIRQAAIGFSTHQLTPQVVGTPIEIADQLEELFVEGACDGFVITPTHFPGTFEEFTRSVVPELQRRGLFRTAYEGDTLRDLIGGGSPPAEASTIDGVRTNQQVTV